MNRFEKAVYDCMKPTEALYERTTDPLHKGILLNYWRHVHLEGGGLYDDITCDDMMVQHPVYRVTWGANPTVIEGRDGVSAFYNSVGEILLWNSDDLIAVADWGISDELTFHLAGPGAILQAIGYPIPDASKHYHVSSRQVFVWPYDGQARLAGEHLYEDKTSLTVEEVDPAELITPARAREIHKEQLARLEARFGPRYWIYRPEAALA